MSFRNIKKLKNCVTTMVTARGVLRLSYHTRARISPDTRLYLKSVITYFEYVQLY